jgi:predicted TIM-barrel fold metal-dependent hydrolase
MPEIMGKKNIFLQKLMPSITAILPVIIAATTMTIDAAAQDPNTILLKNYRPKSIYKTPETKPQKAAFPVIDMHSHAYAGSMQDINKWVKTMDECGIEKTIVLTYQCGNIFDSLCRVYSRFGNRFELWCGFDYTGYDKPGFGPAAVKELERCYKTGAKGVGELGDKGLGETYSKPIPGKGMHYDDPRMKPLFDKCADLGMPVNIHVADPIWMYETMDSTNDGLMNALEWKIDKSRLGLLDFMQLMQSLENTLRNNPKTTFIACHFANCNHDLSILSRLLDKYPNLYADISARYAESSTVPRYTKAFYIKYQDRLLYGTDMGMDASMYRITFRILETSNEHFYDIDRFGYHWALNGLEISNEILKKIYRENALKIMK